MDEEEPAAADAGTLAALGLGEVVGGGSPEPPAAWQSTG